MQRLDSLWDSVLGVLTWQDEVCIQPGGIVGCMKAVRQWALVCCLLSTTKRLI